MAAGDPIILVTVVISGVLAMLRGFTLELLGLLALVIAALIALLGFPEVHQWLKGSLPGEPLGMMIVVGGLFTAALVPLWIVGHYLGRNVRGSAVGVLDRTAGFLFGAVRGLFLLAIAYLIITGFGGSSVKGPDWVEHARLLPMVKVMANLLMTLVSKDSLIAKRFSDSLMVLPAILPPNGPHLWLRR